MRGMKLNFRTFVLILNGLLQMFKVWHKYLVYISKFVARSDTPTDGLLDRSQLSLIHTHTHTPIYSYSHSHSLTFPLPLFSYMLSGKSRGALLR